MGDGGWAVFGQKFESQGGLLVAYMTFKPPSETNPHTIQSCLLKFKIV